MPEPDAAPTARRPLRPLALVTAIAALLAVPYLVPTGGDRQGRELRELETAIERRDAVFDRVVDAVSAQLDLDADVVTGEGLRPMASLGRSDPAVDAADRDALERATVRIGKRPREGSRWTPVCTGVLVDRHGAIGVVTASDCFLLDLAPEEGEEEHFEGDGSGWYVDPPNREREISERLPGAYGILEARAPDGTTAATTLLGRIAADTDWGARWAVASVVDAAGLVDRAIPLDRLLGDGAPPSAGHATATYAFPKEREPGGVRAEGIYLGRTQDPYSGEHAAWLDHVAMPQDPDAVRDACSPGALGATVVLADGTFLGLLRSRNTLGRGPDHVLADDEWDGRLERLRIEAELGIDVPDDLILCSYAVADRMTVERLWSLLAAHDRQDP